MPIFVYRALDIRGRSYTDQIVAESSAAAREMLRGRGLYPVEVRQDEPSRHFPFALPGLSRREWFSPGALTAFTRQLATLLNADMQIVPALAVLVRQSRSESARRLLVRIREAVNEGASLAKALQDHPRVFSPLFLSMVRAGETSGTLGAVLSRLADHMELQQNLRRRLAGALAYPALMAVTGISVLTFMLAFVVPSVVQIFRQSQQNLPWPTLVLITTSHILNAYLGVFLAGLLLVAFAGGIWFRTEAGRWFVDSAKLRLPLFGSLLHKRAVARFGRTLGVLLSAGLPILEALTIARLVVANRVIEAAVLQAREDMRRGSALRSALEKNGLFPPIFIDMVGVGEQSGRLDRMLVHVSGHLEGESEATIQTMMSLVDPVLILVMGVVVGFVVVAILLPLFEINQLVR